MKRSLIAPGYLSLSGLALGALVALALTGCKKDEAPPPMPSAQPVAAAGAAPLVLEEEDAGKPEEPKKPTGTGKPASTFANCCGALRQNAENVDPTQKAFMLQAAGICDAMVASGQGKATIVGAIQGALRGATMPAGCR